jgi:hypothetical protein
LRARRSKFRRAVGIHILMDQGLWDRFCSHGAHCSSSKYYRSQTWMARSGGGLQTKRELLALMEDPQKNCPAG